MWQAEGERGDDIQQKARAGTETQAAAVRTWSVVRALRAELPVHLLTLYCDCLSGFLYMIFLYGFGRSCRITLMVRFLLQTTRSDRKNSINAWEMSSSSCQFFSQTQSAFSWCPTGNLHLSYILIDSTIENSMHLQERQYSCLNIQSHDNCWA